MTSFILKNEKETNRVVIIVLWILVFLQFPVAFLLALAGVFTHPLLSYLWHGLASGTIALLVTFLHKTQRFPKTIKYLAVFGLFFIIGMLLLIQRNEAAYQVVWLIPLAISCLYFDPVLTMSTGIGAFVLQRIVSFLQPITFLPNPEGYNAILIVQILMAFAVFLILWFLSRKTKNLFKDLLDSEEKQKLLDNIQKMLAKLREAFGVMNSSARQFTTSTNDVSAAMDRIVLSAAEISGQTRSTQARNERSLALADELAKFGREIAGISGQANSLMEQTKDLAVKEEETVKEFTSKMEYIDGTISEMNKSLGFLKESSDRISEINDTIRELADQTKLLSFNASIEAARSGEYGRGFAVVAENILELAILSDESTERIEETVRKIREVFLMVTESTEDSVRFLREGVEMINNTNSALVRIREACASSSELIKQINLGNQRQVDGMTGITGYLQEIAQNAKVISMATEETAAGSEETAAAVEEINAQAHYLFDVAEEIDNMIHNIEEE